MTKKSINLDEVAYQYEQNKQSRLKYILDFLSRTRFYWGLPLLVGSVLAIGGVLNVNLPKFSTDTYVFLASTGVGIVMAPAVVWVVKQLWKPNWQFIAEIDASKSSLVNMWVATPKVVSEIDVIEGEAYHTASKWGIVHIFRDFDEDSMEAVGTWMGEKTDVEILSAQTEMKANRGRLRSFAQMGQQLYASLPSITQAIESSYWIAMSDMTMEKTTLNPDIVRSQVVEDVENYVESMELPNENDELKDEIKDAVTNGIETENEEIGEYDESDFDADGIE